MSDFDNLDHFEHAFSDTLLEVYGTAVFGAELVPSTPEEDWGPYAYGARCSYDPVED
ncbi:MAG: hypothetical protein HY744_23945 [Deltaproteobacteria bacterium]|nr:hypothetical protein [Deltaproteobacteria bacterium]